MLKSSFVRHRLALLLGATLLASGCAAAWSQQAVRPSAELRAAEAPLLGGQGGMLMLVGGGLKDDNQDLWGAMYRHAAAASGKKTPRVAVFCTARDSLAAARAAFEQDDHGALSYQHVFERYGFAPVFVPIAIDHYKAEAQDPALAREVASCDAVWFGGGAQHLHARCLLADDGSDTPLMRAVRTVYERGGLIGGTSAGAAIMDEFTYGDGTSAAYLKTNRLVKRSLRDVQRADAPLGDGETGGYTTGFGFTRGIDAAVDTHTDARGRYGRLLVAMGLLHYTHGIALSENTGLLLRGSRGKAYGSDRVFVACGEEALFSPSAPFRASQVKLHVLRAHDEIDFDKHRMASDRPVYAPAATGPAPQGALLETDGVPRALEAFARDRVRERTLSAPGVEFQFSKTESTRAYWGPGEAAPAVEGVQCTVQARP